ncbi:MAG: hypothetical protein AAF937_07095 [Planctomycetota bacterium]
MLWTAIIVGVLTVVIGVPFTYYWFRMTDRWAKDDQKRFGSPDRSIDDRTEIRIVPPGKER